MGWPNPPLQSPLMLRSDPSEGRGAEAAVPRVGRSVLVGRQAPPRSIFQAAQLAECQVRQIGPPLYAPTPNAHQSDGGSRPPEAGGCGGPGVGRAQRQVSAASLSDAATWACAPWEPRLVVLLLARAHNVIANANVFPTCSLLILAPQKRLCH